MQLTSSWSDYATERVNTLGGRAEELVRQRCKAGNQCTIHHALLLSILPTSLVLDDLQQHTLPTFLSGSLHYASWPLASPASSLHGNFLFALSPFRTVSVGLGHRLLLSSSGQCCRYLVLVVYISSTCLLWGVSLVLNGISPGGQWTSSGSFLRATASSVEGVTSHHSGSSWY
jgi:hypothetical protein